MCVWSRTEPNSAIWYVMENVPFHLDFVCSVYVARRGTPFMLKMSSSGRTYINIIIQRERHRDVFEPFVHYSALFFIHLIYIYSFSWFLFDFTPIWVRAHCTLHTITVIGTALNPIVQKHTHFHHFHAHISGT